MPLQLAREDIAGAVISVVKDGKVLFAKGYGYSDVEKRTPVSPETTLFRPGSISKTFTWTALMQQVELGKVNLDHDVNEYIDFKIPATYPQPITVRNLMTHTPGLDEAVEDLIATDQKSLTPLGDYLKSHLPAPIYPPGTIPAYSNYGATLAGYIVQRVSGEPFDLGGLLILYNAAKSWKQPQRWFWSKLGDTALALACVAFTWFVFTWNLLHWSLKY